MKKIVKWCIEFKHFYIPESTGEVKVLDTEFNKAMKKMPNQLDAIRKSWNALSQEYELPTEIKELHGMIVSYILKSRQIIHRSYSDLV